MMMQQTEVNVAHGVAVPADFSDLTAFYDSKQMRKGDMHLHSKYSDNHEHTMTELTDQMEGVGLDVLGFADHNNWYQMFGPCYDPTKHFPVMEYTMLMGDMNFYFRNREDMIKVKNFVYQGIPFPIGYGNPEDKGGWDCSIYKLIYWSGVQLVPNTDFYPKLIEFAQSLGAIVSINHPMCNIGVDEQSYQVVPRTIEGEPNMREWKRFAPDYVEIVNSNIENHAMHNKLATELWYQYLRMGRKIYCTAGTDTHGKLHGNACAHLYTDGTDATDVFDCMRIGRLSIGCVSGPRAKILLNGVPMGGTIAAKDGDLLKIEGENSDAPLRIIVRCKGGVAYNGLHAPIDGKVRVALPIRADQGFYFVEVRREGESKPICITNPIFINE